MDEKHVNAMLCHVKNVKTAQKTPPIRAYNMIFAQNAHQFTNEQKNYPIAVMCIAKTKFAQIKYDVCAMQNGPPLFMCLFITGKYPNQINISILQSCNFNEHKI